MVVIGRGKHSQVIVVNVITVVMGGGLAAPQGAAATSPVPACVAAATQPSSQPAEVIAPFCPRSERVWTIDASPIAVALAGMNSDGAADAVVLSFGGLDSDTNRHPGIDPSNPPSQITSLTIHRNTCVGDFFHTWDDFHLVKGQGVGMAVGDVNTDGRPDAVTISTAFASDLPNISVWLNDGTGHLIDASTVGTKTTLMLLPSTAVPGGVAIGDLDSNGIPDIVVVGKDTADTNGTPGRVWIAWNGTCANTAGYAPDTFAIAPIVGGYCDGEPSEMGSVAIGNLDHTHGNDLILGGNNGGASCSVWVFLNQGGSAGGNHAGRFNFLSAPDDILGIGSPILALAVGRFDADSNDDLAIVNSFGGQPQYAYVARNRWDVDTNGNIFGASTNAYALTNVTTNATSFYVNAMVVADLNGDGFSDIVTGDGDTNYTNPSRLTVLLNQSTASAFNGLRRIQHRDSGDASTHFAATFHDFLVHRPPAALAAGDVNRDGCVDIASAGTV